MKLIFLTAENPFSEDSGAKMRDASVVRLLREQFNVHVAYTEAGARNSPPPPRVALSFVPREPAPWTRKLLYPVRTYVLNGFSRNVVDFLAAHYSPGAVLWLSRLPMAKYIRAAQRIGYRVILDEHNIECDLYFDLLRKSRLNLAETFLALQLRLVERSFCRRADQVVVTSEVDRRRLRELSRRDGIVLPNLIDTEKFLSPGEAGRGRELLFVGTLNYEPNRLGLHWFLDEILPALRPSLREHGWTVRVVGAHAGAELRASLERAGVALAENVPSVLPYLAQAGAFFIPLLSGGGTRLKAIEAFSAALPVVSTGKGVEGIAGLEHGKNIWCADSPAEFAAGIARLLREEELRKNLGMAARELAQKQFDWRAARPVVELFRGTARS